jgi:sterol desaturase/sphingolipid hydroxylase (fatty acid hydroxylase superfamily)
MSREAIDKNFAVHLPVLDWLFGTFHLPKDRWPASYGLAQGETVPDGYLRQFAYPFRSDAQPTGPSGHIPRSDEP